MKLKKNNFLRNYLNAVSPTGHEQEGQKVWLDYVNQFADTYLTDAYGSAVAVINPDAPYKVVIEAHADEISWFVNYISNDGFIYVVRNGGSDHMIAPSMRVNIKTDKGMVPGVFGWPAIHVRIGESQEVVPSLKNIFIDIGCSSKEEVLAKGVHVGCVVTFQDQIDTLGENFVIGRALDNRIGGYVIAKVLKRIVKEKIKLPYCLYVVNAVQEEVGLRGAEMISRRLEPNLAIITDVCHETSSPLYDKKIQGELKAGLGPVLTHAPAVHNNVLKELISTAQAHNIPFQRAAASRATGTDTDAFAYSSAGVPSALISFPLRYMHTTVEMIHKDDVQNAIELLFRFLVNLEADKDYRFIK